MTDLMDGVLATLAFAGVGIGLLVVGFFVIDLLTPGKLAHHVFVSHRRDPALVLTASMLSLGMIIGTSIYQADGNTWNNLLDTAAYGLLGVVLLGVAFLVLDLLTPGKLGDLMTDDKDDPAAWVTFGMQIAVGVIVAASVT